MFKLMDYIPKAELETFCRRNHITKMSLFGSALRDELQPGSDIDILVEFDKNHIPGLLDLAGMEIELAEMFGRKVDLRTPAELSRYFRDVLMKRVKAPEKTSVKTA
jgi:predicted nucleotidyltransferase